MDDFYFKDFCNLDYSLNADFLIASMDVMSFLPEVKKIKSRAIQSMNLKKGDIALEAGCGHGEDAEAIASVIGSKGKVMAIDISSKMINEAIRKSTRSNIEYLIGDVSNLSYANDTFDACHADRLLVSHTNYSEILTEIIRVVKHKGTICVTDVDALSIIMYPYDKITKVILNQMLKSFVNPYMGRKLPELFLSKELTNVIVLPETLMIRDFNTLSKIFQFEDIIDSIIKQRKLTRASADLWLTKINDANKKGSFLYCVALFTVIGQVIKEV